MRIITMLVAIFSFLGFANAGNISHEDNTYAALQGGACLVAQMQRDSTPPSHVKTADKPVDCYELLRANNKKIRELKSLEEDALRKAMSAPQRRLYEENKEKTNDIANGRRTIEQINRQLGVKNAPRVERDDESCGQKMVKSQTRIAELERNIKAPHPESKASLDAENKRLRTELAAVHNEIAALERKLKEKREDEKRKRIAANAKKALEAPTEEQAEVTSEDGSTVSTRISFGGIVFDAFMVDPKNHRVEINWKDDKGEIIRSLNNMKIVTEIKGGELLFATNGGMYTPTSHAQGLLIIDGKTHNKIEKNEEGYGNFFLQPNGVFYIDAEGMGHVVTTPDYLAIKEKPRHATQSGPMLVIKGEYHPKLTPGSENLHIRSGVGITNDGRMVFAISNTRVNFYTFARLFKEYFKCDNALYLDGAISLMYLKDLERFDKGGRFGPIISVSKEREEKEMSEPVPETVPESKE